MVVLSSSVKELHLNRTYEDYINKLKRTLETIAVEGPIIVIYIIVEAPAFDELVQESDDLQHCFLLPGKGKVTDFIVDEAGPNGFVDVPEDDVVHHADLVDKDHARGQLARDAVFESSEVLLLLSTVLLQELFKVDVRVRRSIESDIEEGLVVLLEEFFGQRRLAVDDQVREDDQLRETDGNGSPSGREKWTSSTCPKPAEFEKGTQDPPNIYSIMKSAKKAGSPVRHLTRPRKRRATQRTLSRRRNRGSHKASEAQTTHAGKLRSEANGRISSKLQRRSPARPLRPQRHQEAAPRHRAAR
ncbi:hypothetical protein L596_021724 [Steinernema carpocapsae]|uniref:Uncharacterized protein n=1 Tax=Steinernema carpocapsae TaxID=34508 RepID=A0A4U5MJM8_STECR|nr:hypothetical protein L596_021724 [Steinernema carpocapsae]